MAGSQDGKEGGKLPCKAHAGDTDAAEPANHDLIHHAEGRLKHRLERYRHREAAYRLQKGMLFFHGNASVRKSVPILSAGSGKRKS